MKTVIETKKATGIDWMFVIICCVLVIYGSLTSYYSSTKWWLGIPTATFLMIFIFRKRVLKLSVVDDIILIEKPEGILEIVKKIKISSSDIFVCKIWQMGSRYNSPKYHIEFLDKNKKLITRVSFIDIKNRAETIQLIKDILALKHICLNVDSDVYDPAADELKQLIFRKHELSHDKFKAGIFFDGKNYVYSNPNIN